MGFFKTIGKGLKGLGKVVGKAAPLAALIPGVGPLAAAGLGVGGALLGKGGKVNIGDVLGGAAWGGLGGLGAQGLAGKGALGGLLGGVGKAGMGGLSGLSGLLGKSGLGIKDLIGGAAGAGSIAAGAAAQGRAGKLQNEANTFARERNAQLAPLRDFAIQGLTAPQPQRQDLSSVFADPTNPFRQ